MKYAILLFSLMLSTQSFAYVLGTYDRMEKADRLQDPLGALFVTTSIPTFILADTNETLSFDEFIPELQFEIQAGPSQYFYLRAFAKKLSLEEKYHGNEDQALTDIINIITTKSHQ